MGKQVGCVCVSQVESLLCGSLFAAKERGCWEVALGWRASPSQPLTFLFSPTHGRAEVSVTAGGFQRLRHPRLHDGLRRHAGARSQPGLSHCFPKSQAISLVP